MIPPMRLQGRVAAITGGALGIGRATALLFAEEGATGALGDVQLEAAEKVAQEISHRGGKAIAIGLDVGDAAQVQAFVAGVVGEFGRLDIMFANAGSADSGPFREHPEAQWHRVLRVNLTGVFLCCQAAARQMVRQGGGRIITTASINGFRGVENLVGYNAAKAGVIELTRTMAVELAQHRIAGNSIAPAQIDTRLTRTLPAEARRRRVSLGVKRRRDGVEERVPAAQYRDRNKLGVTLDLKTPAGADLFRELVEHADVVSENFSVGTMERLGLGYEELRRVNPGIVYASITAFGQTGPYAPQRGYDMLAQAISGYMSITGDPDGPPTRSGQSISDYYAGMLCAFSIVSALHYRQRTGRGQRIDLALLDSLVVALDNLGERYTVGGEILTRAGNVSFAGSATAIYPAAHGHLAVAASASHAIW